MYFGIGCESFISVNVSLVAVEVLAAYLELSGIEYMNRTVFESLLDFLDLLGGAGSGSLLVDLGQSDGTGRQGTCPVALIAYSR